MRRSRKRSKRATAGLVVITATLALLVLGRYAPLLAQSPEDAGAPSDVDGGAEPAEGEVEVEHEGHVTVDALDHGETQEVIVGCYVHNVEAIDLSSNSYSMSLELWMKWRGPIDPTETFRIVNVLDEDGLTVQPAFDAPIEVDDHQYQRFHINGRFFHKFWLGTFPLDWQRVTFELADTRYPADVLRYVPDQGSSGVDPIVRLPGWRIIEERTEASVLEQGSDYGMGNASPGSEFPAYELSLTIERPVSFYLFKIFPPILITLACCLLVFLLRPTYVDARVGTPIAGLLTAVFLQLTFTGGLPNLGIMLLIDHIFNLTYAVIFVVALSCILTSKSVDEIEELQLAHDSSEDPAERERVEARIRLLDRRMHTINRRTMIALPVSYLVGIVAVSIAVRGTYIFEMFAR